MRVNGRDSWVRLHPSMALVLVGDGLVILALIAVGLETHAVDPIDRPEYTVRTAAPFLLGWLVMAPLAGALGGRAIRSLKWMLVLTGAAWIGAAMIGLAIRATPFVQGGADPIFVLVMLASGLAALLPWRGFVWLVRVSLRGRRRLVP